MKGDPLGNYTERQGDRIASDGGASGENKIAALTFS